MARSTVHVERPGVTRRVMLMFALGGAGALSGCAAATSTPSAAPAKPTAIPTVPPQPTTTAAPKPTPAPSPAPKPTQAPAKPQIAKVTIAQPATGLAFAPITIAQKNRFFEDESIEADGQLLQSNPLVITSVLNDESQFAATGSNEQFATHEKGLGLITVAGFPTAVLLEFAVRNAFLQEKGATPQQPLKDKIAALKGAKIGVASLSGTAPQFAKYAMKMNGLDPESEVEFIVIGQQSVRLAALRQGQVDAFILSPPDPQIAEAEGFGSVFIRLGEEVPGLNRLVYESFFGKKSWIEQNPGITERVCGAIGRANNLILNDLPAAKETIKAAFPQINPQILDVAMDRVQKTFPPDARMTEEMWKNAADVYLFAGAIKAIPPLAEGTLWTNKYLVNVPKR